MKNLIKQIYTRHIESDLLKLRRLQKLKAQHQHFETLESTHDTCYQITQFGHSHNLLRAKEIAELEAELGL